jgi:hypothetical protein
MKYRRSKSLQRSLDTKEILRQKAEEEARDAENWRIWEEERQREDDLADEIYIEREDC